MDHSRPQTPAESAFGQVGSLGDLLDAWAEGIDKRKTVGLKRGTPLTPETLWEDVGCAVIGALSTARRVGHRDVRSTMRDYVHDSGLSEAGQLARLALLGDLDEIDRRWPGLICPARPSK